jgi:hypothetical protein
VVIQEDFIAIPLALFKCFAIEKALGVKHLTSNLATRHFEAKFFSKPKTKKCGNL